MKFPAKASSGIATGMVGALIFLQKARISPDAAFSLIDWTAYAIFIVVIGGIGTTEGPIIGVVIFYLLQYYLAALGSWYLILLGALAIILMLFAPAGVWGLFSVAAKVDRAGRPRRPFAFLSVMRGEAATPVDYRGGGF